jgi:hypothetical protein
MLTLKSVRFGCLNGLIYVETVFSAQITLSNLRCVVDTVQSKSQKDLLQTKLQTVSNYLYIFENRIALPCWPPSSTGKLLFFAYEVAEQYPSIIYLAI